MHQNQLFSLVIEKLKQQVTGYLSVTDEFLVPPFLGDHAGMRGCVALGQTLLSL